MFRKGATPKRLGEDLLAAKSKEPLNVIVAKSHVKGGKVFIDLKAPATLEGRLGQTLHVKHSYRAEEDSTDKEEYRFLLNARLDDQTRPPAMARIGDVYAVAEDVAGYLIQEFVLSTGGTHTLSFDVGAEYVVGGWKNDAISMFDQKQAKGTVTINVR